MKSRLVDGKMSTSSKRGEKKRKEKEIEKAAA